ncbi:MAG: nucleotidyltransferase domain-containing protein [Caldiserica bacterium]|nr:MAG: nucleotidyltransferase domain-containing protein [Caldisericota bacterium]
MGEKVEKEKRILSDIVEILKKYLNPEKIILFGSRAENRNSSGSDFDIAISGKRPDMEVERKIRDEIEKIIGLYKFDIVFIDSVEEKFKEIILKTGRIIYERGAG